MAGTQLQTKNCWKRITDESVRHYEKQQLEILYDHDTDFIRYKKIHTLQTLLSSLEVTILDYKAETDTVYYKKYNFSSTECSADVLILWSSF